MKILVTGASGQIGWELVDYLLENGLRVTTLGRKKPAGNVKNFPWSLGMSPTPEAFIGIDYLLHLAWSTKDRGNEDFHINVGGSLKIIETSKLSGVKVINISSLSVLNSVSSYGNAKAIVERANFRGINLRIAKVEKLFLLSDLRFIDRFLRKILLIPVPRDLRVYVTEMDQVLREIHQYCKGDIEPGTYTIPYECYGFAEYIEKYHGFKSFNVSNFIVNWFFTCCRLSCTRKGKLLHDRWTSLVSTDEVLRQPFKSF